MESSEAMPGETRKYLLFVPQNLLGRGVRCLAGRQRVERRTSEFCHPECRKHSGSASRFGIAPWSQVDSTQWPNATPDASIVASRIEGRNDTDIVGISNFFVIEWPNAEEASQCYSVARGRLDRPPG